MQNQIYNEDTIERINEMFDKITEEYEKDGKINDKTTKLMFETMLRGLYLQTLPDYLK